MVFTRYPEPGKVKTRLIPALGAEGAARLQKSMTEYTLHKIGLAGLADRVDVEVWFEGAEESEMKAWLGPNYHYRRQSPGDIGDRMLAAFKTAYQEGCHAAVLVGTDCPGWTGEDIDRAFGRLAAHDAVLGPARDGGYYLIGLRQPYEQLFSGIPWSTGEVLKATTQAARRLGLHIAFVATFDDVDKPEDLEHCYENESPGEGPFC